MDAETPKKHKQAEVDPAGSSVDLTWKPAICGICPAGCWVEVDLKDGRMAGIRADESHALGMICRRGMHAPEIVHSVSTRLSTPLRRTGAKGSYDFEPISWDEAYQEIAGRLNSIKDSHGAEATAIYTGRGSFELSLCDMFQPKGVAVSSASNVLFPFGSPNTMGVGAICYVSFAMIAPHVTMGRMLINMFTDMENAQMLVVWGSNPATDSPPLDMHRLEDAAAKGTDIVVIDPRRTETVTRTGAQWVPIRPGTDGALALSMIQVMIEEDIYDETFAENWCQGFDELVTYVQHFTPEVAESTTGVPADTICDLARRICRATGAAPVMYTGLEYSNSGIQAIRAVLTLFALADQLDVPGGMGLAMEGSHFPINRSYNQANPDLDLAVARDRFPVYSDYRDESHISGLVKSVLEGDPYAIRGLIVQGSSLLTSCPETPLWRETLEKLDFLVCIDRQMTADCAYADIVLPATTMFEIDSYMTYGPIFRVREKMVEPVGEARNDYLIMAGLAEALGYGHLYPQTEEEVIEAALEGSGFSLADVRAAGGMVKIPSPIMEYKKWEKGGLRPDGKPGFDTPSGKFEIWSSRLDDYGLEPLPKYTEPVEGPLASPHLAGEYPLIFNSGARPHTDFRSQHHGIAGLCKDNPEPTVELNRDDAETRGIEAGDLVEVRTPRGAVPFRARVSDDLVPGAIECNMGGGTPVGPQAWREWNVNMLTDLGNCDKISGFPVYKCLLCEVVKIEPGTDEARQAAGRGKSTSTRAAQPKRPDKPRKVIYLDNNATTPIAPAVRKAMKPFQSTAHGNPSSIHAIGREASQAMEMARRQVAAAIHGRPRGVIFTGGGSEADNMAIKGAAITRRAERDHVVTSAVEHPAILQSCQFLEKMGFKVTYLDVDEDGLVRPGDLARAVTEKTSLVTLMMANNEVGSIHPIHQLADIAHAKGAWYHSDAIQAVGKIEVDVEAMDVDMMSVTAHKFHGPKGVGALYVKKGIQIEPLIHGGGQEEGRRGGTENVASIIGLGKAAELAQLSLKKAPKIAALRDRLEAGIRDLVPGVLLNGHREDRLPNTLNLTLPNLRGESLVIALDRHGVSLSSGSACKSGSPEPTHVLLGMGRDTEQSHCAIRLSLSRTTTKKDIEATLQAFARVLEEMETTVRFIPCK